MHKNLNVLQLGYSRKLMLNARGVQYVLSVRITTIALQYQTKTHHGSAHFHFVIFPGTNEVRMLPKYTGIYRACHIM